MEVFSKTVSDSANILWRQVFWYSPSGNKIHLDLDPEFDFKASSNPDGVLVEDFSNKKIIFYDKFGKFIGDIPIPEIKGHMYRGLNSTHYSKSGVSVIFYPETASDDNPWADAIQLEVDLNNMKIGDKVGIFR